MQLTVKSPPLVRDTHREVSGDFSDPDVVWNDFIYHVAGLPGVTILGTIMHRFPGGGLSGLILLGESHAAIHTWPERNQAWIELATCGDPAALDLFGSIYDGRETPMSQQREAGADACVYTSNFEDTP